MENFTDEEYQKIVEQICDVFIKNIRITIEGYKENKISLRDATRNIIYELAITNKEVNENEEKMQIIEDDGLSNQFILMVIGVINAIEKQNISSSGAYWLLIKAYNNTLRQVKPSKKGKIKVYN